MMSTNAKRYLELISQHLQEHHAALLLGRDSVLMLIK